MHDFHDWEYLGSHPNEDIFASLMVSIWKCKKCKWKIETGVKPESTKRLYRRLPNQEAGYYNCEEIIVLNIQEN
jgi:hypothetical protein